MFTSSVTIIDVHMHDDYGDDSNIIFVGDINTNIVYNTDKYISLADTREYTQEDTEEMVNSI